MQRTLKRVFEKYKDFPAPMKASFWYMVCSVLQRGISVITTPIFTRLLSTEEYGVYSVYTSWYQIVLIFCTLNLFYGVYHNGMTKWPEDRERFTSSLLGLTTTITACLFIVYLVAQSFWNRIFGLDSIYIYAMFIEILCVPAYSFWSAGQRYDYQYRRLIVVTLFMVVATPCLGVICVLNTRYKAVARVLSAVFVQICVGLFFYVFSMIRGKCFYHKQYWKYALAFNIPLIPHYLSTTILNQADRLMIKAMVGTSEAAIYSVSYNVATLITIVTTALTNTFTPYMYKSMKSGNYEGIKKYSTYLLLLTGFVAAIIMALGPEVIVIFATEEYYDAIWVIPPVACAIFFKFLYPLFSNIEFYYENTRFVMVASCLGAVLNIILNYIFIPLFGYVAAGYTTLACYMVYSFSHYFGHRYILGKYGNVKTIFDIKVIMAISCVMLVVMVGMTFLYNYAYVRYVVCALILLALFIKHKSLIQLYQSMKDRK